MKRMKKLIMQLGAAVAALIMCVMIASCGKEEITGTWKFYSESMSFEGISVELKVGLDYNGIKITEDFMTLEVREDNTFTLTTQEETVSGTWKKESGKQYSLTGSDGIPQIVNVDGNVLTMEASEDGLAVKVVFDKSDS